MKKRLLIFCVCLSSALAPTSSHAQDFYANAKILYESNVFESAIDFLNAKEGPLSAREWKLKGDCYHKMKEYEDASEAYTESIIMDKKDAESIARRGATYLELGEIGFAIRDVKKALKIMPESAEAHFNMGNICYDQDDMAGAIKNYKKALIYRPEYPPARYMLGASKSNNGDQVGASDDFEAVKEIFPEARYNIAVVELENENFAKSIEIFNDIETQGYEESADFYFFRAEAHYFIGDKEMACENYEKAGNLGDEESLRFFESYCLKSGKKGKAKKRDTQFLEF